MAVKAQGRSIRRGRLTRYCTHTHTHTEQRERERERERKREREREGRREGGREGERRERWGNEHWKKWVYSSELTSWKKAERKKTTSAAIPLGQPRNLRGW